MDKQVWTPRYVNRSTVKEPSGFAVLAVRCSWDQRHDTLRIEVDGGFKEWHRRGARMFDTRQECIAWISEQGLVHG